MRLIARSREILEEAQAEAAALAQRAVEIAPWIEERLADLRARLRSGGSR